MTTTSRGYIEDTYNEQGEEEDQNTMALWTIDLNSFQVEADTKEEAEELAIAHLSLDVRLAFPLSIIKEE